ncbi:MAG: 50S ribosomal protein P1, partial [Promethearchaeota archaeon]
MESIYAALLLHKANKKITEANLEKVLEAAGTKVDKAELTKLIAGLKEVKIEDIIKSAGAAPVMAAPTAAPKKEKKKEAKKEEE